jgi:predicted metal-binding membrane protein
MQGGGSMSIVWMPMCGQTWLDAAVSFLGMWVVMMVAMMLPSLMPTLWRYRQTIGTTDMARRHRLTALIGVGYLFVWTLCGLCIYPLGVGLSAVEMWLPTLVRIEPFTTGLVVLIAGSLQFTAWRARRVASASRAALVSLRSSRVCC